MPNRKAKALRVALAMTFILSCAACGADAGSPSPEPSTPENETRQTAPAQGETLAQDPAPEDTRQRSANAAGPVEVETTVIATNLEVPWGFAFLPNGDALFTERDSGRLSRMDASGNVEEVQTLPTRGYGEGGSLGLAVSPDYEQDGYV